MDLIEYAWIIWICMDYLGMHGLFGHAWIIETVETGHALSLQKTNKIK
ncbi:hypothetical protein SDC9_45016 [bioreactor metagenome]|jgi:hypothetical protein|uniref:Uncharacterized protein n=1 Tax=bioreactor metagenome TaxID=1076179 RepID=A0A644W5M1_9ZZZZ